MSAEYEAVIAQAFVDFLDQGFVYKGLKPVNWCIHDRTALAEAEVEYENHTSPSIWVKFALTSDPAKIDPALAGKRVFGLIWTTTPWTIPANLAIAFHPKFTYVSRLKIMEMFISSPRIWSTRPPRLATGRRRSVLATFPGEKLDKTVFRHPFLDRDSIGILGDHVTLEQGTGAVHTAPGHGAEDYVSRPRQRPAGLLPRRRRGKILSGRRRAGTIARGTDRQNRLGRQSHRHRDSEERRSAWPRRAISATAIRIAGAATSRPSSAPPNSGSSAWTTTTFARTRSQRSKR